MPILKIYKKGLELIVDFEGKESKAILLLSRIPFVRYDEYSDKYRALPMVFWEIIDAFKKEGFQVETDLWLNHSIDVRGDIESILRPYQKQAALELEKRKWRGVIVLPTGAGKTLIGLYAMSHLRQRTLIIVPTIDLMEQWKRKIMERLIINPDAIGVWKGDRKDLREITIITYQSASKREFLEKAMDKFNLVIFDEVHHLPARTYIEIAKRLASRYRLGLTATPKRVDQRENLLPMVIGDIINVATTKELVEDGYLAPYEYKLVRVSMNREEWEQYRRLMNVYKSYIEDRFPNLSGKKAFERVVKLAWKDRKAKEALEARMKAKAIAMAPESKIEKINEILKKHKAEKVIIFTRLQRTAYLISHLFGIPVITANVPKGIRKRILDMFRTGKVTKLVSAEALDEGIDVPDASVGIIVSGTSSQRQFIQRVGRLLRPSKSKAIIYELVTRKSFDEFLSKARKGRF